MEPKATEGLTEGRMVHYVLPDGRSAGEHRPAVVVKVWRGEPAVNPETGEVEALDNGLVQLQVFADGDGGQWNDGLPNVVWRTSVVHDEENKEPGTWHWIEAA